VVTTSSMTTTRRPATAPPSAALAVPYSLACLRTNTVGRPVSCDITVAMGMPPSSIPASTSHWSGSRATIASATSRSRTGCASNRYLSKYSSLTWPDRSRNEPVRWQAS
jgi:hypothetical protein